MYFPRRRRPLDLSGASLRGLRLSLNAPVVTSPDLPVGPARAAIVVHVEADGRSAVTVAVRSLRSGEVVPYSHEEALEEGFSCERGVDAALAFGEGMGFLFDEDELGEGADAAARERAFGLWQELMGGPEGAEAAAHPSGERASPLETALRSDLFDSHLAEESVGEPELLLEDLEEAIPSDALARDPAGHGPPAVAPSSAEATRPAASSAGTPPPGPVAGLSKFRFQGAPPAHRTASGPAEGEGSSALGAASSHVPTADPRRRRTALGRLRLVKRKRGGGDERTWILRLLTSF